ADAMSGGRGRARRFASCNVGDRLRCEQRDFAVVGQFTAKGSAFESEIWGDAAVLMPALHRQGYFQTFVFRMKDPGRFEQVKQEIESDPRLQVQVLRERAFYAAQSESFTVLITIVGAFITVIMAVCAVVGAANTMYAQSRPRTR